MADVLALTKLNYNTCIYGDGVPMTLRFADAVGEILTAPPRKNELPPLPLPLLHLRRTTKLLPLVWLGHLADRETGVARRT